MKIIIWISGATAVIGAALVALTAGASVGDVIYSKRLAAVELSGPQKTALGAVVVGIWPGVSLSDATEFVCNRRLNIPSKQSEVVCAGAIEETITESEFADRLIVGSVNQYISKSGGNVTLRKEGRSNALSGSVKTNLAALISELWPANDIATMVYFLCLKNGTDVSCEAGYVASATPADFATDYDAGNVIKALGRVE